MGEESEKRPLLDNTQAAGLAVLLTGFMVTLTVHSAFFAPTHRSHWLFPFFFSLPRWVFLPLQFAFTGLLLGLCVGLFRSALGKERVFAAAWFPIVLLTPLENALPESGAHICEGIQALGMATAFLVCLVILREQFSRHQAK